ncbi:adhesin [Deinococcus metallilatus]|uniref:Adhesin n=1 Tax=Deinococcus metallilatus TaxID=1211322 RepID=A0AAJ5K5N7_9DEIO|nr:zinc ABC transporter substrate-binding protein [Deinococcus metallilatus]MBB5294871.1 zinc/manganese transport system substrate-binding protein/manganese/iron transport system substrate-binding protein [Deinococcus metallilatus]QBY09415.1 adhesin [Deinococcus metallilatus]RXJ09420.1 adhesin [Deinococcus metallilatus]TLK28943.1 adhesin [Deinococcus metallilatus]GMA16798.1 adhesin B [Deinococcus metallilatus]
MSRLHPSARSKLPRARRLPAPLLLTVSLAACASPTAQAAALPVSATTSIIGDFVKAVGGNRVSVNVIVPPGGDTHSFQPTTAAIRGLAGSRVLFANGAGLEPWLPKLKAAAPSIPVQELTAGLKLHTVGSSRVPDPHAWWDPALAAGYIRHVQQTLTRLDPAGKAMYANNAAAYLKQLAAADAYARKQFATLPASHRQLVTNHDSLHSLADRYGLKIVGTVLPGLGTEREPGARELAALVQAVKQSGARVIFTENTVNARLAQALAHETGAKIAPPLYTDALGPKGSAGDTYLKAFRANVDTIVKALR